MVFLNTERSFFFSKPLNLTEIDLSFMHGIVCVTSFISSPKAESHNKDRSKKKKTKKEKELLQMFCNGQT